MKSLCDYTRDAHTALFEETGTFFAFSQSQLSEKQVEGVEYCSLGGGMIVPKENAKRVVQSLEKITKDAIAQDLTENGKEAIIKRELVNYECYYICDISDCVEALERYEITEQEIRAVYNKTRGDVEL